MAMGRRVRKREDRRGVTHVWRIQTIKRRKRDSPSSREAIMTRPRVTRDDEEG